MKGLTKSIALFLALSLFVTPLAACTPAAKKAVTKKEFKKRTTNVTALYVVGDGERMRGGKSNVKITVEANPAKSLRVGFYESEVGGSGPMWRAAGWMAAVVGPFLIGQEMSDYKFTFDVAGKIDGPSAGGLMTAAVLASILGDEIKDDVTMTGTINPDGSIGPVGGIVQKLDGAKSAKKKTVLIPIGLRYSTDENTGEAVDVVELGNEKGLKVKEVADIYEVYKELTGKPLPKLKGAVADSVELPSGSFTKVKSAAKRLYSQYLDYKSRYEGLAAENRTAPTDQLLATAAESAARADKSLNEGQISGAYDQSSNAAMFAGIAYQIGRTIEKYRAGGLDAARQALESDLAVKVKMDGILDDFKGRQPQTLSELLAISEAFGNLSVAYGLSDLADERLNQDYSDETEALTAVAEAASYYSLAATVADLAKNTVDIGWDYGKDKKIDKKKVARVAQIFRKAAEANIDYFDNVVLNSEAEAAGVSLEVARASMENNSFEYRSAVSAINILPFLKKKLGKGPARDYAVLGNSLVSYQLTSGLVAKYYSLGAQEDDDGNLTGIAHEKAMTAMLNSAKDQAESSIGAAEKVGAEPVIPIYYLEGANISREGSLSDKIDSLYDFWMASTEARLMAMFGGAQLEK